MTEHYPVVVEREENGTFSAWFQRPFLTVDPNTGCWGAEASEEPPVCFRRGTLSSRCDQPSSWVLIYRTLNNSFPDAIRPSHRHTPDPIDDVWLPQEQESWDLARPGGLHPFYRARRGGAAGRLDRTFDTRFEREAKVLASLNHEHRRHPRPWKRPTACDPPLPVSDVRLPAPPGLRDICVTRRGHSRRSSTPAPYLRAPCALERALHCPAVGNQPGVVVPG